MKPLSRRTLLRGAGVAMALPFLEAMMLPRYAQAQSTAVRRFIAFFYPNGTDPRKWNAAAAGAFTAANLPECLQDLKGFAAEGIWPAEQASFQEITAVTGVDHSGVCTDIHMPSMSLSAFKGTANSYTPPEPTLDQYLADRIQGTTPHRNLALSATGSTDIGQGNISFRAGGQVATVMRDPKAVFNTLFGAGTGGGGSAAEKARLRQMSVLSLVREDATRLTAR
ncbi:MAG: DUF1552 domain-containing protein, partial [Polyangiaceae bacterium]